MNIALIGNPNAGKTVLFNELTGASQHVGNWPGVTVEQKRGQMRSQYGSGELVDLPGIYSLTPFSLEEVVSRDYILSGHPDVVINIVDATNLERNLYLSIQLIELNAPIVVALNMMDEVDAEGFRIDFEQLGQDLGVPVVGISAKMRTGLHELVAALDKAKPSVHHVLPNEPLELLIAAVEQLLAIHLEREHHIGDTEAQGYPLHWTAIKVLEGDELVYSHLTLDDGTMRQIDQLKEDFVAQHGLLSSAFAEARYNLIHQIIYRNVTAWSAEGDHHHHLKHAPTGYLHESHDQETDENAVFSQPHYEAVEDDWDDAEEDEDFWGDENEDFWDGDAEFDLLIDTDDMDISVPANIEKEGIRAEDIRAIIQQVSASSADDVDGDGYEQPTENSDMRSEARFGARSEARAGARSEVRRGRPAEGRGPRHHHNGDDDHAGFHEHEHDGYDGDRRTGRPARRADERGQRPGLLPRNRRSGRRGLSSSQLQSDAIDRVLTNRFAALPIFLVVMFLVFHLTFSESLFGTGLVGPGVFLQGLVENAFTSLQNLVSAQAGADSWVARLVNEGIIGGVGTVLTFTPQILLLFFFLTLLEDCGYMARAAFIMDHLLRRFGLSGRSFLPMLMGFGCTVPAVMAARTMDNPTDRRLTLMLVPFISCGARAPIYLVMAAAFFPAQADLVVFGLYLMGIVVAIISGILLRKLLFKGETTPFIIELPRYRAPHLRSLMMTLWERLKDFLVRAGTVIFVMCVVLWLMTNYGMVDGQMMMVDPEKSILVGFGRLIAPIFTPLGFGFWIAAVAIVSGFIAKESVISSMAALVGIGSDTATSTGLSAAALSAVGFTPLSALSFMVFCLLYLPCVAAFAALRREFGSWRWTIGQAAYSLAVAYFCSFLVYQIGSLFVG